jgi:hypothetical protein
MLEAAGASKGRMAGGWRGSEVGDGAAVRDTKHPHLGLSLAGLQCDPRPGTLRCIHPFRCRDWLLDRALQEARGLYSAGGRPFPAAMPRSDSTILLAWLPPTVPETRCTMRALRDWG